ncbi:MAG TPA: hypothetical protein VES62_12890, partial [Thermoleophilaceae bacterium]|nr:hypothetical protein [Thermoleophilaceae bacterium]
ASTGSRNQGVSGPEQFTRRWRGSVVMAARYRIELSEVQGRELRRRAAHYTRPHREVVRAKIMLLVCPKAAPAPRSPGGWTHRINMHKWRMGFAQEGLARLGGAPGRRGRFSS